jgi:hypothetical protein
MSDPTKPDHPFKLPPIKDGADLLRRIGWHPSDMKQIELYARMSPAQKIEQMFQQRQVNISALKEQLQREHPECNRIELSHLLQERLDLEREYPHVPLKRSV